ncbi:MAG: tetratricopeptide repeat protein [Pseudomonadota bacterium]
MQLRDVFYGAAVAVGMALPSAVMADDFLTCLNELDADIGVPACEQALNEDLTTAERAEVFLALGLHERKSGNLDAALGHFDEASDLSVINSKAMTEIGLVHYIRGDQDAAISAFSEALAVEPDSVRALNNRAVARASVGRYTAAVEDLNLALTIDANDADLWNNRANVNCELGAVDQAYRDRIQALYAGRFTAAAAQSGLRKSGYYDGPSDGIWGPDSEDALLEWTKGGCPNAPKTRLN